MTDERFPNWEIDIEKGEIYSLKYKKYIGSIGKDGYLRVGTPKGYKHRGVHQYIWMCANQADIPEGYDVHHIDGNKLNNNIYNLELIESIKHRSEHKKGIVLSEEYRRKLSESQLNRKDLSKQVMQFTLDGELVKIWESTAECGRNGFNQSKVSACCRGERKKHKGFKWEYYEGFSPYTVRCCH